MIGKFIFAALLPCCVFAADSMNIEDYFTLDPQAELVYMEINRRDPAVEKSALELYRPSVIVGLLSMCDFSAENVAVFREVSAFCNLDQYSLLAIISEYKHAMFVNRMFGKWRDGCPNTGFWTVKSDQPVDMKKFIERTPAGAGLALLVRLNVGRFFKEAEAEIPALKRFLAENSKLEELLLNLPDNGEYYFNVIEVDKKLYTDFELPIAFSQLSEILQQKEVPIVITENMIRIEDDFAAIEINAIEGGVRVNGCLGDGKADFATRSGVPNLSADREFNRMAKLAESDPMPNAIIYVSPSFITQIQSLNPHVSPEMKSSYQSFERYSGELLLKYYNPDGVRETVIAKQDCALQMIELEAVVPQLIILGTILPFIED